MSKIKRWRPSFSGATKGATRALDVLRPFACKSPRNLPYNRGLPRSRASKASLPSNCSVQSRCKSGEVASFPSKERTPGGTTELLRDRSCVYARQRNQAALEESRLSCGNVVDITRILAQNVNVRVLHWATWQCTELRNHTGKCKPLCSCRSSTER